MRRYFVKRSEIMHSDSFFRNVNAFRYWKLPVVDGKDSYDDLLVTIVSRNGNKSRDVICYPLEIENVSGLYYWFPSSKRVRACESVYCNGKKVSLTPIARLQYNSDMIYCITF